MARAETGGTNRIETSPSDWPEHTRAGNRAGLKERARIGRSGDDRATNGSERIDAPRSDWPGRNWGVSRGRVRVGG